MYQILNGVKGLDNFRCHPLAFTQRHGLDGGCKVTGHAGKNTDLMSSDAGGSHPQMLQIAWNGGDVSSTMLSMLAIAEMRIDRFAKPPQDSFLTQCADEPAC